MAAMLSTIDEVLRYMDAVDRLEARAAEKAAKKMVNLGENEETAG